MVTRQLQDERRTGKVRRSKTNVLPLCHATNKFLYGDLTINWGPPFRIEALVSAMSASIVLSASGRLGSCVRSRRSINVIFSCKSFDFAKKRLRYDLIVIDTVPRRCWPQSRYNAKSISETGEKSYNVLKLSSKKIMLPLTLTFFIKTSDLLLKQETCDSQRRFSWTKKHRFVALFSS